MSSEIKTQSKQWVSVREGAEETSPGEGPDLKDNGFSRMSGES